MPHSRPDGYFGQGTVQVSPPMREGESGVRRLAVSKDRLLSSPTDDIATIPDIIDYAARVRGTGRALGWRNVKKTFEDTKRVLMDGKTSFENIKWTYFQLSKYKYINYLELKLAILELARGMVSLGIRKEDSVNIYAQTSMNWKLISHACALISTRFVSAYDTLGDNGLAHSLIQPKCIAVFTHPDLLPRLIRVLPHTPTIKFVFYDGVPDPECLDKIHDIRPESPIRAMHIDELRKTGEALPQSVLEDRRPTKDTMACVMYTSGSTGAPKGVCLTHANLVAAVTTLHVLFGPHLAPGRRYLAHYIPLAHTTEYAMELCAVFWGVTIGYASKETLTNVNVRYCKGDISTFKPNIMLGTPAVYEELAHCVDWDIKRNGLKTKLSVKAAFALKRLTDNDAPVLNWIINTFVLDEFRTEHMGGHIKLAINIGGPISRATQELLNLALMPLTQGYGLAETSGISTILPPELLSFCSYGSVGLPGPCLEIKLLDVPTIGYIKFSSISSPPSRNAQSSQPPQGEICIRGTSVIKEYFNRPDLNEDENIFTKDGWFRTGDLGQWNADGTLTVVDRLTNLVKMQNEAYISLERLEAIYKLCSLVSNLCVYADSDMAQPIAVICPNSEKLRRALPIPFILKPVTLADRCKNPRSRPIVLKKCNAQGKTHGLAQAEMLIDVILTPVQWTIGNGLLTVAGKVNRQRVWKMFAREIEECKKPSEGK